LVSCKKIPGACFAQG